MSHLNSVRCLSLILLISGHVFCSFFPVIFLICFWFIRFVNFIFLVSYLAFWSVLAFCFDFLILLVTENLNRADDSFLVGFLAASSLPFTTMPLFLVFLFLPVSL